MVLPSPARCSERNLAGKLSNPQFCADMSALPRPGFEWKPEEAAQTVAWRLIRLLPASHGKAKRRPEQVWNRIYDKLRWPIAHRARSRSFHQRDPGEQSWLKASAGFGNYDQYEASASAGSPLGTSSALIMSLKPRDPVDSLMLYTSAAKGFKSGGFNGINIFKTSVAKSSYGPETNWTYEIGVKTEMLRRRSSW